jgi:hypothetical protein
LAGAGGGLLLRQDSSGEARTTMTCRYDIPAIQPEQGGGVGLKGVLCGGRVLYRHKLFKAVLSVQQEGEYTAL